MELLTTFDLWVLATFAGAIIAHSVFVHKSKLLIDILAVYGAIVLTILLGSFVDQIQALLRGNAFTQVILVLLFFLLLRFAFSHSNIKDASSRVRPLTFTTSLVYRISIVGLLFAMLFRVAPARVVEEMGSMSQLLFTSGYGVAFWLLLPLALVFTYKFHTENGWLQ